MRSFNRSLEYQYDNTRMIIMELVNGNPHIKKAFKFRRKTDVFRLSIDIDEKIEPVKITVEMKENLNRNGYTVPDAFIKKE